MRAQDYRLNTAHEELFRYSWLVSNLRDEASVVQPSASVDRVDQWWDLSQNPVSARTPNLIDGGKVASVVAIAQIRPQMFAHLNEVPPVRSIEFHVDSDPERVPPGWPPILPEYKKYSPVASESCAWSKADLLIRDLNKTILCDWWPANIPARVAQEVGLRDKRINMNAPPAFILLLQTGA